MAGLGGLVTGLAVGLLLSLVAAVVAFILLGGPVADGWTCSRGEFPATNPQGGKECFPYGRIVPPGWHADRQGNQPE